MEVFSPSKNQMKCKICLNAGNGAGGAKERQLDSENSYFQNGKMVSKNTFVRGKNTIYIFIRNNQAIPCLYSVYVE